MQEFVHEKLDTTADQRRIVASLNAMVVKCGPSEEDEKRFGRGLGLGLGLEPTCETTQ